MGRHCDATSRAVERASRRVCAAIREVAIAKEKVPLDPIATQPMVHGPANTSRVIL